MGELTPERSGQLPVDGHEIHWEYLALDDNLPGYRAIATPTLIMAGAQDRAIPPWVQNKLCGILPCTRYEPVEDCGHVVYLERPEVFFGNLKAFARAKRLSF